jgi:hypothetical protein
MLATTGGGAPDQRGSELASLQREYRHMELNRRAYAEESNSVLRKQQVTIDKLRKDNEAIKQVSLPCVFSYSCFSFYLSNLV